MTHSSLTILTNTFAKKLFISGNTSKPVFPLARSCAVSSETGPLDDEGCLYPKSFSNSRDVYYTTNSKGEVVEVPTPGKQFNTKFQRSLKADFTKPPVALPERKPHPTKGYSSIPQGMAEQIKDCAEALIIAPTDSILDKSPAKFLYQRYLRRTGYPVHPTPYYSIPKGPEFEGLKSYVDLTVAHLYDPSDWPRVRSILLDYIRSFGLDALLEDDEDGYVSAFGDVVPSAQLDFNTNDLLVSHLFMSLIHIPLFGQPSDKLEFYSQLQTGNCRTRYILTQIDFQYKSYLIDISPDYTAKKAIKELLSRAIPYEISKEMIALHYYSQVFKIYTEQLTPAENPVTGGGVCPWFTVEYINAKRHQRLLESAAHYQKKISQLASGDLSDDDAISITLNKLAKLRKKIRVCQKDFCELVYKSPYDLEYWDAEDDDLYDDDGDTIIDV